MAKEMLTEMPPNELRHARRTDLRSAGCRSLIEFLRTTAALAVAAAPIL
jgi:hypothetical protein